MALRVTYELSQALQAPAPDGGTPGEVVLILADSSDVARGRYGDTEERIRALFDHARTGPVVHGAAQDNPGRRTILLFDDVETLFMSRTLDRSQEWHLSQNSVFFHQLDGLDTSRVAVFLTTNRPELMDEAVVDRFMTLRFDAPPPDVLRQIALDRAADQRMSEADLDGVLEEIASGGLTSAREVERLVQRRYVEIIASSLP